MTSRVPQVGQSQRALDAPKATDPRGVVVVLAFALAVEELGERASAIEIAQAFTQLGIETRGQVGNPDWIATPISVQLVSATG